MSRCSGLLLSCLASDEGLLPRHNDCIVGVVDGGWRWRGGPRERACCPSHPRSWSGCGCGCRQNVAGGVLGGAFEGFVVVVVGGGVLGGAPFANILTISDK